MEVGVKRYQPLYLKYRPQLLSELVGQRTVVTTLTNAIENGRLTHAYLLTGPRGTGKTSTARILAKSLNCLSGPTAAPCQNCTACHEITLGVSPAVFEIDAASNNSVDDARSLIERAPLVAVGGRYKLYIIDECHMLTKEAFNALLKTIEEPPANVIFVLATTEEHKVPQTIVSRCQKLMFRLVSQEELSVHLKEIARKEATEIDEPALALIARRSGGGLRDALGLIDQAGLLSQPGKPVSVEDLLAFWGAVAEDVLVEISQQILEKNGERTLALLNALLQDGREPLVLVMELSRHFLNLTKASYLLDREAAVINALDKVILGSEDYLQGICRQAPGFDRMELSQIMERLGRLSEELRRTTQPALALEIGVLSLCHRHDIVLVRDLSERMDKLEQLMSSEAPLRFPAAKLAGRGQASMVAPAVPGDQAGAQTDDDIVPGKQRSEPDVDRSDELQAAPADQPETQRVFSEGGDDGLNQSLDIFWSRLLEELQKRHLPTYSLVSMQAFPISAAGDDVVLGVAKDHFQKMLENKLEHIKAACEMVVGRPAKIKIKVMTQSPAGVPQSSRAAPPKFSEPTRAPAASGLNATGADAHSKSVPPAVLSGDAADESQASLGADQIGQPGSPLSVSIPSSAADTSSEAYKLFEGPGSRFIG